MIQIRFLSSPRYYFGLCLDTHLFVKVPRQRSDLFSLWVKLPPVTTSL